MQNQLGVGTDNRRLLGGKYTGIYSCLRWNGNGLEMGASYFLLGTTIQDNSRLSNE